MNKEKATDVLRQFLHCRNSTVDVCNKAQDDCKNCPYQFTSEDLDEALEFVISEMKGM